MNRPEENKVCIRCGTDLVEIARIEKAAERLGSSFLDRLFTAGEQADCLAGGRSARQAAASFAVRFAAKEAVAKALGTGIWREGIGWTDIAVRRAAGAEPEIVLSGAALARFQTLGGYSISISLSHEHHLAMAFCVLACQPIRARETPHAQP